MLIKKPSDIPSSEITPKESYLSRRKFITGAVALLARPWRAASICESTWALRRRSRRRREATAA